MLSLALSERLSLQAVARATSGCAVCHADPRQIKVGHFVPVDPRARHVPVFLANSGLSRENVLQHRTALAGRSRFKSPKLAGIGRFVHQIAGAVVPHRRSAQMESHRSETSICQTIQTQTCTGATASVGAAYLWPFSSFWALLRCWHWPGPLVAQMMPAHQSVMPSPRPLKQHQSQPTNTHRLSLTAKGRRRKTPAFRTSAPQNGACPC